MVSVQLTAKTQRKNFEQCLQYYESALIDSSFMQAIAMNRLIFTLSVMIIKQVVRAQNIVVTDDSITADLTNGRTISAPLAWYPRPLHGKPEERNNWRLIGKGEGILRTVLI